MKDAYYSLVVLDATSGLWFCEFGDYVKAVVIQEWQDVKHHYPRGTKKLIIKHPDTQFGLRDALKELQSKTTTPTQLEI